MWGGLSDALLASVLAPALSKIRKESEISPEVFVPIVTLVPFSNIRHILDCLGTASASSFPLCNFSG